MPIRPLKSKHIEHETPKRLITTLELKEISTQGTCDSVFHSEIETFYFSILQSDRMLDCTSIRRVFFLYEKAVHRVTTYSVCKQPLSTICTSNNGTTSDGRLSAPLHTGNRLLSSTQNKHAFLRTAGSTRSD